MKKILAVISAVLFLGAFALFAACDSPDVKSEEGGIAANPGDPAEDSAKETPTQRIYPDLEAVDFGGYEFTVLTVFAGGADWVEWNHRDISADEINGDVINDAVYLRNKKIEEKYNIQITEDSSDGAVNKLTKSIKAGEDAYDAFCSRMVQFVALSQNGNFVDLFAMPYLDLSKPWWDRGTIRDLSVINKLFILQGDLLIMDNDAMETMIFNKAVLQSNALENPYDIVKSGEWTFDKLTEMSRGVSKDLNGDGEMYIKDDLFGLILQRDTAPSFIVSGGEKIVGKDENDYPVITFGTERCYKIMEAISTLMLDEDNVVHLHRYQDKFPIYDEQVKMFEENRGLFSWIRMRIVERLRGMEMDFGIIPCPKLDKAQANYFTRNNPHTGAGISIPITAGDLERTGMILEDLSAESRYTLQPAYYEINLRGKYARDDESQEMLDIILSNTAHDIGDVYNFGGFGGDAISYNGQRYKSDYAADFDKVVSKMEKDIEKVIAAYEKLD